VLGRIPTVRILSVALSGLFLLAPASKSALACGLAPHVGPTGAILECDGREHDEVGPWRVALQGGALRSELSADGMEIGIEQLSMTARGEYRLGTRFTVGLGGGSILGGSLRFPGGQRFDLGVGWTVGASFSALALAERSVRPFILASLSAAYSATQTSADGGGTGGGTFIGRDVRLGLAVGKTFGFVRPYAAARLFGGGFRWEGTSPATTGGDSHLYQVGAGAAIDLPGHFDVVVEAMPLGERSVTAGLGRSF
jgi:hypothetical protein